MSRSFLIRLACVFACIKPSMHGSLLDLPRLTLPHLFLMDKNDYHPDFAQYEYLLPIQGLNKREIPLVAHRIECSPNYNKFSLASELPWITYSELEKKMTFGENCANYLKDDTIYVSDARFAVYSTKITRLFPIPPTLPFRGYTITTNYPGLKKSKISDCCDQRNCSHLCAEPRPSDPCYLNLYTVINAGSDENRVYNYQIILSIPCIFCQLTSCTTQCQDGQVDLHVFA